MLVGSLTTALTAMAQQLSHGVNAPHYIGFLIFKGIIAVESIEFAIGDHV
jgi:hypothetical protein